MSSITRRWLQGSLLVTLLLVALAEGFFIYAIWPLAEVSNLGLHY